MSSVVRFRTGDGGFAVSVAYVREVRTAAGLRPIPSSRPGVAGMITLGDEVLTVLSVLGSGRDHVLVMDVDGTAFGLMVEEVVGVVAIDDRRLQPPPAGHGAEMLSGVVSFPDEAVLVVDAAALARTLQSGRGQ